MAFFICQNDDHATTTTVAAYAPKLLEAATTMAKYAPKMLKAAMPQAFQVVKVIAGNTPDLMPVTITTDPGVEKMARPISGSYICVSNADRTKMKYIPEFFLTRGWLAI